MEGLGVGAALETPMIASPTAQHAILAIRTQFISSQTRVGTTRFRRSTLHDTPGTLKYNT